MRKPIRRSVAEFCFRAVLILMASIVRFFADSYRKFRVGCVVVVYKTGEIWWKRYRIFVAANTQKRPGPHPERCCAERKIRNKIKERLGVGWEIWMLVIVAPHQPDDVTGIDHGATLPCVSHCHGDFKNDFANGGPVKPWTWILGFNPRTFKCIRISAERYVREIDRVQEKETDAAA